jgi:hypothetical protein
MNNFGQYTVSSLLPPAPPLQITTGVGWEYLRIINNSAYLLNVNLAGMGTIVLPEYFLEDIYLPSSYRGSLVITPQANVTVIGHSTSNMISINTYQHGEISQPQAQPLSQPAVTTTASGKPIFTALLGFASTSQAVQTLNIFNPAASGVVATFHAARISSNTPGIPQGILAYIVGADLNLSGGVLINPHTASAKAPISVMHATSDDAAVGHGGTIIDDERVPGSVTQATIDLLTFPDVVVLYPGTNLLLVLSDTTAAHTVNLVLKWTEDVVTPIIPVPGGVNVAGSIKNDGNPVGTQIVEATVSGDGSSAVIITNDAQMTLGDVANPGSLTLAGPLNLASGTLNRIWISGQIAIAIAGTSVAHGLGVIPLIVLAILDTGAADTSVIAINYTTMTSTHFTAYAEAARFCRFLALA